MTHYWPAVIFRISLADKSIINRNLYEPFGGVMRRSGVTKFPNSVQLFKFCQKVLTDKKGGKVHDQEVGAILSFNPSDCSHWKRGEKNVKSVFSLAKLAEQLELETSLIHDIASGQIGLEEAYFEYTETKFYTEAIKSANSCLATKINQVRKTVSAFAEKLLAQAEFSTPPLYLPEVLRFFPFIVTQPSEMMDKLSRILRTKPGQYTIQYRKGELKPQTRMSITKDLARIVFEAERAQFSELANKENDLIQFEELLFVADLLIPKHLLLAEISKLDSRKNIVSDLATLFWVPKSLVSFQLQDIIRSNKPQISMSKSVDDMVPTKSSSPAEVVL